MRCILRTYCSVESPGVKWVAGGKMGGVVIAGKQ